MGQTKEDREEPQAFFEKSTIESESIPQRLQASRDFQTLYGLDPLFAPHADVAFEVEGRLGEGGMGTVLRVRDARLGRSAALKQILPELAQSPSHVQRFLREAFITASLDHPAIPPVYEAGRTAQGQLYLLMRVIEGQTLADRLAARESAASPSMTDCRELLEVLRAIAQALAHAHGRDIVHRDLKPENIMIGEHGQAMLMDWGLARNLSEASEADQRLREGFGQHSHKDLEAYGHTQSGHVLGTPGYMAPEQARGEEVDAKADVYALGVTLTEILTGRLPVSGDRSLVLLVSTIEGRIRLPRELSRAVPRDLNSLAAWALAADPEERPSAEDFADELSLYLGGEDLDCHDYGWFEAVPRMVARRPVMVLTLVFALLFLGVSSNLWTQRQRAQAERQLLSLKLKASQQQQRRAEQQAEQASSQRDQLQQSLKLVGEARQRLEQGHGGDELAELLKQALDLSKRDLNIVKGAAKIFEACQDWDRAEALYLEVVEREKKPYAALIALHEIQSQRTQNRFQDLSYLRRLNEMAEANGDENEYTLYCEAVVAIQEQDFEGALARLTRALEINRRFALVHEMRGLCLQSLRRYDEALKCYEKAFENDPRNVRAMNNYANLLDSRNDIKGALRVVDRAIKIAPKTPMLLASRGYFLNRLGRYDEAIASLKRSLKLNPKLAPAMNTLAAAHCRKGNYDEAIRCYSQQLRWQPKAPSAYYGRGYCYQQQRRWQPALSDFLKALELHPKNGDTAGCVVRALHELGREREAMRALETYTRQGLSSATLSYMRGFLLLKQRRYREAVVHFDKACVLNPRYSEALFRRGAAYLLLKKYRPALASLNKVLAMEPQFTEAYYARAQVFVQTREYRKAREDLKRSLALFPKNHVVVPQVQRLLRKVEAALAASKQPGAGRRP